MTERLEGLSELRLWIKPYPKHTTVALITRTRRGVENLDRRQHVWDLPLPQGDYSSYRPEDQLWMVLGALAASTRDPRAHGWAKPPEPPDGGYRGEQSALLDVPQST